MTYTTDSEATSDATAAPVQTEAAESKQFSSGRAPCSYQSEHALGSIGDGELPDLYVTPLAPPTSDLNAEASVVVHATDKGTRLYGLGYGIDQCKMEDGGTAIASAVEGETVDATNGQWTWMGESDDAAWGADVPAFAEFNGDSPAHAAVTVELQQILLTTTVCAKDRAGTGNGLGRPAAAHAVATALRPLGITIGNSLSSEMIAAAAQVAFPGNDVTARLRRGVMEVLQNRGRFNPISLAELGVRLSRHPAVGNLWNDPSNHLPKLSEFAEGIVATAPGVLTMEPCEGGFWAIFNPEALRMVALRRAVAAAYPGGDDTSLVRRAAAAALLDAESPVRHSLNMPSLGVNVIQMASEARQRLAEAHGTFFSLAGVLQERRSPMSGSHRSEANGDEAVFPSYFIFSSVGTSRIARLDVDRLLADAAAGRLGDLTVVQPVKPKAAVAGSALIGRGLSPATDAGPAPTSAAAATTAGSSAGTSSLVTASAIVPRVKEVLRAAIPEGCPEMHAKRCLALLAAASLGGGPNAASSHDPPYTLRSSPCGTLLHDLGLKPPKGQMRALFDDEPHVFLAGKPSPNYLVELIHQPLLDLAVNHPEDVATSVAALLQGRTYIGVRLRTPGRTASLSDAVTGSESSGPTAGTRRVGSSGGAMGALSSQPLAASSLELPAGQPSDYYQRLERAMLDRLEGSSSSTSDFIKRARRILATALFRRTWWGPGPHGPPPQSMSIKDAATLLKAKLPEAYQDKRPPGVFPINTQVLAQQMPLIFTLNKPTDNPKDWYIRLNINSLELSAGLNPTLPPERDSAAALDSFDEPPSGEGCDFVEAALNAASAAAALPTLEVTAAEPPPSSAAVAGVLATQPARALATALASMVPPDLLPEPHIKVISVPYSAGHVTALSHCLSCPQIGLAAKGVGGMPSLVLLYAPAVDSLKPAAANAAGGAPQPPTNGVLPATVYILDASAAAAANGSNVGGGGSDAGVVLLNSLRVLLEEPGVAKVVHGCEQLIPALEHVVGCVISPLLDTRLVSEMLKPLDLDPPLPLGPDEPHQPDEGRAPELWPQPSNWQAALSAKYQDYYVAALHHASGADSFWLNRPLNEGQLSMLLRAVQHLPELWSALTWLLPRLAQFCSIARAQQCRALLAPMAAW